MGSWAGTSSGASVGSLLVPGHGSEGFGVAMPLGQCELLLLWGVVLVFVICKQTK